MIAAANPAGFTFNTVTNEMQCTGYAVALAETQNSFGADGLESVISLIQSGTTRATCVGGWLDETTGLYYYDATVIVETKAEALAIAKANKQIAIFHLDTLTEIRL